MARKRLALGHRRVASRALESRVGNSSYQAFDHAQSECPSDTFVLPHAVLVPPAVVNASCQSRIGVSVQFKSDDDMVYPSSSQTEPDLLEVPFLFGSVGHKRPQNGASALQRMEPMLNSAQAP